MILIKKKSLQGDYVECKNCCCSYTALESMNKQADCKPTAHPIFDKILTQQNKKFDWQKGQHNELNHIS